MSSREAFLKPKPITIERVDVPGYDEPFYVRVMSTDQRDKYDLDCQSSQGSDLRAKLLVWSVCDQDGVLIFKPEDKPALSAKDATETQPIFEKSATLNKFFTKDVETLEKN